MVVVRVFTLQSGGPGSILDHAVQLYQGEFKMEVKLFTRVKD